MAAQFNVAAGRKPLFGHAVAEDAAEEALTDVLALDETSGHLADTSSVIPYRYHHAIQRHIDTAEHNYY